MDPFYIKIGAFFGILVLTAIGCAVPKLLLRWTTTEDRRPRALFLYLLLFSSMLISSVGIIHVYPNSIDAFNSYSRGMGNPWPGIIACGMIVLCYILDTALDPRKQTMVIAYEIVAMDSNDDLPPANPWLFTGAIYIDSILEGLVLGSSPLDTGPQTRYLYIVLSVLAIHKAFEGFALATIYEAYMYETWMQALLLIVYSALTPLGIFVGMKLLVAFSGYTALVIGICAAVATGVFIYSGISIMVSRVIPDSIRSNWRYVFIFAGFLVASLVSWFA